MQWAYKRSEGGGEVAAEISIHLLAGEHRVTQLLQLSQDAQLQLQLLPAPCLR